MDINDYSRLALRTANLQHSIYLDATHAALGIGGEAGEILDHVKKVVFNHRAMDREHLIAELGDLIWYCNLLIEALGTSWSEVLEANIAKLEARYPNLRFEADKANQRDTDAEQAAIRKALDAFDPAPCTSRIGELEAFGAP